MILETLTAGLLGLVGYMVKKNTTAMERIADNISYCPTNQKYKKKIKG